MENNFCGACGARLVGGDPRTYTPRHLAEKILNTRSALVGERKLLTVLFVDVQGSGGLSGSVDAERWHGIMDRFFSILTDCVHRYEGTINQFTGDGVMALFGAPVAHEDHARRACQAALDIDVELRSLQVSLASERLGFAVRMGMNSGEVVVGRIGDDLRMDYTAQGYTTTLASRMQVIAEPGSVCLTQHTAALVDGFFELRDLGTPELKGVSEPVRVYQLEGRGELLTRLDVSRARGLTRWVGRGPELGALESALARALDSEARVIGVVGEAGVGKSRLCLEFLDRCRERGLLVVRASCPAYGRSVPLLPVRDLLRGLLELEVEDEPAAAREKIEATLLELDPGFGSALPLVYDLLGVGADASPLAVDPASRRRRVSEFVGRLLQQRSTIAPLILAIEDLHWIDPESDELLARIVDAVGWTRTLLVLNFRQGYSADWMSTPYYTPLPLVPLDDEAAEELLRSLLGDDPSVRSVRELVRNRTGGNPFFIEEVVQELVAAGSLVGERGSYRPLGELAEIQIPMSVVAVIEARIDRLPEREKQLLQTAAVIGRSFSRSVLEAVSAFSSPELEEAIVLLCEGEFIYRDGGASTGDHAFKHSLTHEVAYLSQLQDTRQEIHATVARALEELHADRLGELAALLVHHWAEAGQSHDAARWRRRAALKVSRIQIGGGKKRP